MSLPNSEGIENTDKRNSSSERYSAFDRGVRLRGAGVRLLHRCPKNVVWRKMEYGNCVSWRRSRNDTQLSGRRVGYGGLVYGSFVEVLIKDIPERKEVEWVAGNAEA